MVRLRAAGAALRRDVRLRSVSARRYCRAGPPTLSYGATLSPFERLTLIGVAESGACRAVAREVRAGESG
jgi:hypothetical protein